MQRHSNALKEKYKSSKSNNRDKKVQAMFQEVMAQYMEETMTTPSVILDQWMISE